MFMTLNSRDPQVFFAWASIIGKSLCWRTWDETPIKEASRGNGLTDAILCILHFRLCGRGHKLLSLRCAYMTIAIYYRGLIWG